MGDDEDDIDFFTRRPRNTRTLSRTKSASISDANTTNHRPAAVALTGIKEASPSQSGSSLTEEQRKRYHVNSSDSESDVDIFSSSEEEIENRRRVPKKVKKRIVPVLPRWSRENRSASIEAENDTFPSVSGGKAEITKPKASDTIDAGLRRDRDISLTPPPPPSPDKLQAARALVEHVRASHRNEAYPRMRAPLNESTEGPDTLDEDGVDWDPEVAKLYRGDNAKQVRERAKKMHELRRQMRQSNRTCGSQIQSASDPSVSLRDYSTASARGSAFSRTVSAPNPNPSPTALRSERAWMSITNDAGEDSDDSIQLVSGASSARPVYIGDGSNATAAITLTDSDDQEGGAEDAPQFHTPPRSPPKSEAPTEDQGEVMSLTLSSSLGTLPVSVRPAAKLSKIIAHFVATFRSESRPVKQRLPESVDVSRIKIRFDGMLFEPNPKPQPRSKSPKRGIVSDLDVEDGDQIEIVW